VERREYTDPEAAVTEGALGEAVSWDTLRVSPEVDTLPTLSTA
jgi:hypothetical protein